MPTVTFAFDPTCPWTWTTSRWLQDEVAPARDLDIEWRSFSLELLNPDRDVSTARKALGRRSMRVTEGLAARGEHDEAGRVYTAFGTALHDQDDEAAAEAALAEHTDLADDAALDEAIGASFAHHQALVGEDVGSPVLVLAPDRTIFGPILATLPTGEQALRIWDGVAALACCEDFYELKRGRS